MPNKLTWTDTEDIAEALYARHPAIDPLKIRFTDLFKWVTELDGFSGDTGGSKEKILEAIQMAWYELKQEEEN